MSNDTITINENIVRFDNLLTGLEYLMEEVNTRKETILSDVDLNQKIEEKMNTRRFKDRMMQYVQNNYGEGFYREVAFMVMEKIDSSIEEYINNRVDKRFNELVNSTRV